MDLGTIVSNLGFPIGVSIYLLVRFEKKMTDLEKSIENSDGVKAKLDDLIGKVDECRKELSGNHK